MVKISDLISVNEDNNDGKTKQGNIPVTDLLSAKSADWNEAKRREKLIGKFVSQTCSATAATNIAGQLKISERQVYRLIKKYHASGEKLVSLLPRAPVGGKGKSRLPSAIEEIIGTVIQEIYMSKQRHKESVVVQEVRRRCKKLAMKAPSKNTIRARIESISNYQKFHKRLGKHASNKFVPIEGRLVFTESPLEIVQIDHTKVDIILVDEVYRQSIGRPYLTVAIDEFSRCITGRWQKG